MQTRIRAAGALCALGAAIAGLHACGNAAGSGAATPTPAPSGTSTPLPTATPPDGDDHVFRVAPAAASTTVYVADTDNDDVAKIESITRHVDVIPVGRRPLDLSVSPDGARFATFNSLSHDVSIVATATFTETRIPVRPVTNAMTSSPLGTHGVCYYETSRDPGGAISGSQSPGEVSVVDFAAKTVVSAVMGSTPRQVGFTPDDTRAFVLSDGLLASIDLTAPGTPRTLVPTSADPSTAPIAREMAIAPDGTSALVLTADAANGLVLVDLIAKTFSALAVGAPGTTPTDLDLTADGRYYVVASAGATTSTIDLFDRQQTFARTTITLPGPAGSIEPAPDAPELWAFSRNAADERLWRIELSGAAPAITEYALVKPVRSIFVAPAGAGVVVLHRFEDVHDGAPANEDVFENADVMTVIDPDTGGGIPLLSPVALAGPPDAVAVTSDGAWAFAQIPGRNLALVIDLASLLVNPVPLSSRPLFVGAVPAAHTGYLLQQHPLGRLSFITPETMQVQTVTGFEINGEIH